MASMIINKNKLFQGGASVSSGRLTSNINKIVSSSQFELRCIRNIHANSEGFRDCKNDTSCSKLRIY